jgi:hypothetical protein
LNINMEKQSALFFSNNPISASQWKSLANSLLDLGVNQADITKLEEMTSAHEIYTAASLRTAMEVWVKLLKIECAHGICSINMVGLNDNVIPMLDKFLGGLKE